jgi:hypothetical protein
VKGPQQYLRRRAVLWMHALPARGHCCHSGLHRRGYPARSAHGSCHLPERSVVFVLRRHHSIVMASNTSSYEMHAQSMLLPPITLVDGSCHPPGKTLICNAMGPASMAAGHLPRYSQSESHSTSQEGELSLPWKSVLCFFLWDNQWSNTVEPLSLTHAATLMSKGGKKG